MASTNTKTDIELAVDKFLGFAKENNKTSKTWIGVLVSLAAVASAMGLLYFQAWKKGKEFAKLETEHDDAQQKAEMAKVDAQTAVLDADKKKALDDVATHTAEAASIQKAMENTDAQHAQITAKINQLSSWDDVDAFLNGK